MNDIMIDIGFIKIKWYSFFILLAIIIGGLIVFKESKKKDMSVDEITDILFYGILFGILGARLYYVLFNLSYYLKYPIEIIKIWNGGLAIHGGIIAGLIFLYFYTKKNKRNIFLLTDIMSVGLIIAQAIGRWGNFFNKEAYGRIVSSTFLERLHIPKFIINGMYIDGFYREPTFLYESIFNLIGFIILLLIRKNKKIKVGQLTGFYLTWYGIIRVIIESFRADSLILGSIKAAQLVSIILIIIGLFLLFRKNEKLYIEEKWTNKKRKDKKK